MTASKNSSDGDASRGDAAAHHGEDAGDAALWSDAALWDEVEEAVELLREGERAEAVALLRDIIAAHRQNAYAHFFLAQAFFEEQRWAEALAGYVAALEQRPRYLGAMIGAGQCLRFMGRYDHAVRMARQALLIDKDDADALYLAGMAHFAAGRNAAAKGFLLRFLETRPEAEVAFEVREILASFEAT